MKDKKKLIIILGSLIGILLIIACIYLITNKGDSSNNNKQNDNKNNTEEKPSKISSFEISLFEATLNKNKVDMSFKLTNKSKETINDKYLSINLYNKDKLLYTYDYKITNINANESVYINANPEFEYDNITKYEFVIDKEKVVINK
ncbi:MAG: hypothetical protein MR266_04235 [Erysipelotrichaceae bacterium]|nr:hypothetical protein [Erysipelotrichaceae bacterium]